MGLFGRKSNTDNSAQQAETFIRENTALYRHYCIPEVQSHVKQFTGVKLSDREAVNVVQRIRDEKSMGPISEHNLPQYVNDEPVDDIATCYCQGRGLCFMCTARARGWLGNNVEEE